MRGIERRAIFADDDDRHSFVRRLSDLLVSSETDCLSWALLDNHFHLLLRPRQTSLSSFMRRLLTGYAVTFNLRHSRSGHLFQNRYKSIVCEEEEYLLELVRYVHLNPLRAGVVSTLEELDHFPWSGHAVLMGKAAKFSGQTTDEVLSRFGSTLEESRRRYRSFVGDGVAMGRRGEFVGAGLHGKLLDSEQAGEERRDSRILGSGDFVDRILLRAEPERRPAQLPLEKIVERVCCVLDVSRSDLTSLTRAQRIADARSIICHHAFFSGHRGVDIARHLGITGAGVTVAAKRGKKVLAAHPELHALV